MANRKLFFMAKQKLDPDAPVLGKLGHLETRLARTKAEVRQAQELRYQVFYGEMNAKPSAAAKLLQRDKDHFDRFCDHLLVLDTSVKPHKIVATYRMMLQSQARNAGGFYTQTEYELSDLLAQNSEARFLELGRSCVLADYRNKRTMELLWHGTWSHAVSHKIDIMFGCASFEGTSPELFKSAFGWLNENAQLKPDEKCTPISSGAIKLSQFDSDQSDLRKAMAQMPTILKGYLRLGAKIGTHAVIDQQFDTTDVLVVLKVADINPRYLAHFGADASRFAA